MSLSTQTTMPITEFILIIQPNWKIRVFRYDTLFLASLQLNITLISLHILIHITIRVDCIQIQLSLYVYKPIPNEYAAPINTYMNI